MFKYTGTLQRSCQLEQNRVYGNSEALVCCIPRSRVGEDASSFTKVTVWQIMHNMFSGSALPAIQGTGQHGQVTQ